jgi:hypothetical protein
VADRKGLRPLLSARVGESPSALGTITKGRSETWRKPVRAMEMQVKDRPQTVQEFLDALSAEGVTGQAEGGGDKDGYDAPEPTAEAKGATFPDALLDVAAGLAKTWLQKRLSAGQATTSPVNLSGEWRSSDGAPCHIQQIGNVVTMQLISPFPVPMVIAQGQGTITGLSIQLSYGHADGTWGMASLDVSTDGRRLAFKAANPVTGAMWNTTFYR